MPNVTIALDEATLRASREYAAAHGTTLNEMIRQMLRKVTDPCPSEPMAEFFALADEMRLMPPDFGWSREDIHEMRGDCDAERHDSTG